MDNSALLRPYLQRQYTALDVFWCNIIILGISNFGYAISTTKNKMFLFSCYCRITLLYTIYLYTYYFDKVPFDIPQWIASDNLLVYAGTFIMPTLVYSLFVLVSRLTPGTKHHKAWVNFLAAISIPVLGYLFFKSSPLWRVVEEEFSIHALLIIIILQHWCSFFFLIKVFLLLPPVNLLFGKNINWLGNPCRPIFQYWVC